MAGLAGLAGSPDASDNVLPAAIGPDKVLFRSYFVHDMTDGFAVKGDDVIICFADPLADFAPPRGPFADQCGMDAVIRATPFYRLTPFLFKKMQLSTNDDFEFHRTQRITLRDVADVISGIDGTDNRHALHGPLKKPRIESNTPLDILLQDADIADGSMQTLAGDQCCGSDHFKA